MGWGGKREVPGSFGGGGGCESLPFRNGKTAGVVGEWKEQRGGYFWKLTENKRKRKGGSKPPRVTSHINNRGGWERSGGGKIETTNLG